MFVRQLNPSGPLFLVPLGHPALCRASSSYLPQVSPPRPWWPAQGFPPWPPRVPRPVARPVFPGGTPHPWGVNPVNFAVRCRPFNTSAGPLMEPPNRAREPPHKRRKSAEDGRGTGEEKGGAEMEHHLPDSSSDIPPRPTHSSKDGSRGNPESGKGSGKKTSTDKDVKLTRAVDGGGQLRDNASRDETPNRGTIAHHQGGREGSQAVTSSSEAAESRPGQDKVTVHKPNPWFKDGGPQEQGRYESRSGGDGGPLMGLTPRPCGTTLTRNPWQVSGAIRQPPPPGPFMPVGQWQDVTPVEILHRRWETLACNTDIRPPEGGAAFDFSVMSYNILSQQLLLDNEYLYQHCNPHYLHWNHRLTNLLAEIQLLNADILCLQEVQQDHYEIQIKPALQALGYQCEYKKRTGRKPDGCAVVFKSSRLALLSSNPIEFLRPGDALLDRDNVGLVLLLQPVNVASHSNRPAVICVANTHLLYNPRRGDVKLAQLAILLAEIDRLARLPDGSTCPVVLCGDFNSTPSSPLYRFLTNGFLDYKGLRIGMVSGQESSPKGQRLLTSQIWSQSLGIDQQCQYNYKPTAESSSGSPAAVEGAISNLTVEDAATNSAAAVAATKRSRMEHNLKLQSSYQHRLMPDGRPEITTCHSRTAMTVDYILYTPDFTRCPSLPGGWGLHLLARLMLVGRSELLEINGLPNKFHSSDHLPLLARFRLWR